MKKALAILVAGMMVVLFSERTWAQTRSVASPSPPGQQLRNAGPQNLHLPAAVKSSGNLPKTAASTTAGAADWLVSQQFASGGFPWTPGDAPPPPSNTQGPTARGLLKAYQQSGNVTYKTAATKTGDYLVPVYPRTYTDGDPRFATHDPLFLEELSQVTGDPKYANFVQTNFWDKLTAGTYGETNDLDAAEFGDYVVDGRTSQGIVELSPWDLSGTAIAAHIAGETAIRNALMSKILRGLNETTSADNDYDVIGLAGAVWASAVTGVDLDPTAGRYASDNSTADLAARLANIQRASDGAWVWSAANPPCDPTDITNGDLQVTAFAIMALNAQNRSLYISKIATGATFIKSLQQSGGQFLIYPTASPTASGGVESHAEALSALVTVAPSAVYVDDDWVGKALGEDPDGAGPAVAFGYDAFAKIQDGIDNVYGSTVNVAAGTYTATSLTSIVIDKSLSLIGESRDGTIIDAGTWGTSGTGWPRGIQVKANNVTIKNFTVQGFTGDGVNTGGYGIVFRDWDHDNNWDQGETLIYYTGGRVENVKLQNNNAALYALLQSYLTVTNCLLQNNSADGMFIARWSDHATIMGNTVLNSGNHGIWVGHDWTAHGPSGNATITGNTVDGAVEGGISFVASNTASISNNDISHVYGGGWSVGAISLKDGVSNVTVSNNVVHDNTPVGCPSDYLPATGRGIGIDGTSSNITLSGNLVYNNVGGGVKVQGTTSGFAAHSNAIYSNTGYGAENTTGTLLNFESNWWGNPSGPLHATTNPSGTGNAVSNNVDYSPWWGANYVGDAHTSPWTWHLNTSNSSTIGEGVTVATAGDEVVAHTGTYKENVNLNKALKLVAGSGPIIDGNGTGNCVSLAANGVTIDGFTLTNGYNGVQGETKSSTIRNCIIHTNKNWVGSNGVGICLWGDNDNNTVSNNTIYNNDRQGIFIGYSDASKISTGNKIVSNTIHDNGKYTLANGPDQSRYGIQLHIADENLVQGNTIYNHKEDPSFWFANGVYIDGSRRNTVAGNNIYDNTHNVAIWNGTITGTRSASGNKIQANTLVDPGRWSVKAFSDAPTTYVNFNVFSTATTSDKYVANSAAGTLNAEYNWFGGENPPQSSDFSGTVDYSNYFSTSMTVSVIPLVYYLPLNGTVDVPVMALVPAGTYVRGTDVTLSWDNDTDIPDQSGPTQGSFFTAKVGTGQSEFYDYNPHTVVNTVRVNQGLLGGSTGAGNASVPYVGVLFTMNYKGVAAGTSNLTLSSVQVRDVDNNDITPLVLQNAQLVCDATAPSVTNVLIDNTTLNTDENSDGQDDYVKNTDNVTVTATVTDDHPLTTADIFADLSGFYGGAGHTADNPSTYASNVATWTVSGVSCSPANGTITVSVLARDVAGNEGTGSDGIVADNTAPTAATNLVAKTISPNGHQKVDLSWTNGTDTHLKGTLIRYKGWGYPTYSGSAPAYPTTPTEGDGSVTPAPVLQPANTVTHAITARDIYSYSAFAVDWAGNYASYDASASDLSANYYLGDLGSGGGTYIPGSGGYDGQVNFDDLFWFSRLYFSTAPGWTSLDPNAPESDFGPTVANKTYAARHRFGVPHPDGVVDFEDLMIFAMNYMNVAPKVSPPTETKPPTEFALELQRQMANSEEMVVTVHLANDGKLVKGTSVLIRFDPTYLAVKEVTGGTVFGPLGHLAFFAHKEGSGTVQMDAAALGIDRTVNYSGDVGTIRFKVLKSGETGLRFDGVKVRNGANEEVSAQTKIMEGVSTTIPLPTTYDIAQNYPNPFNPTTTIAYQVPEVAHVTLEVYSVLGERVATLVDEQQAAGYYRIEWNGKDREQRSVSSGVYYYRMSAGQFTSIKKMLLVK